MRYFIWTRRESTSNVTRVDGIMSIQSEGEFSGDVAALRWAWCFTLFEGYELFFQKLSPENTEINFKMLIRASAGDRAKFHVSRSLRKMNNYFVANVAMASFSIDKFLARE